MLAESFRKLEEFGNLQAYRYIGFGSTPFADFALFHKSLGISNSISIEHDEKKKPRFEFNKPYGCIKLMFGESGDILSKLVWDMRTIIWLDYDYKLKDDILTDIDFVVSNILPGSMLLVTVDARPAAFGKRLEEIKAVIEAQKIPHGISEAKLGEWGTANTYREIITNEINEKINARNGTRPRGSKFIYKQLYNFHYADGSKMLTVGGLIHDEGQKSIVAKCAFDDFDFVRADKDAYEIRAPSLTLKEIHLLDKQLPCTDITQIKANSIPQEDILHYSRVYRYYPAFVDAEIG
jgi:hypothetical protein